MSGSGSVAENDAETKNVSSGEWRVHSSVRWDSWSIDGIDYSVYNIFHLTQSSLLIVACVLLLGVLVRTKALTTRRNMTVSNSILADVFIGITGITSGFIMAGPVPNTVSNELACMISMAINVVLYSWTAWAVALMALDCYDAIAHPLIPKMSTKHVVIAMIVVCVESVLFAVIPYNNGKLGYGLVATPHDNSTALCRTYTNSITQGEVILYMLVNWLLPTGLTVTLLALTVMKAIAKRTLAYRDASSDASSRRPFYRSKAFKYMVSLIMVKVCLGSPHVIVLFLRRSDIFFSIRVLYGAMMVSKCNYLLTCVFYFMWIRSVRVSVTAFLCGLLQNCPCRRENKAASPSPNDVSFTVHYSTPAKEHSSFANDGCVEGTLVHVEI
jgi:hypothetical protein